MPNSRKRLTKQKKQAHAEQGQTHIGGGFHIATISETVCQIIGKYEWNHKKTHADDKRTRDFEKYIVPCVSMCLQQK